MGLPLPPDVNDLALDINARHGDLWSIRDIVFVLVEEFQERPLAVLKLFAIKSARSWYATDTHRHEARNLRYQIPFLLLIAAGAFACCRRGGAARRLTIAIGWIVLYCWLMTTAVLSIQRYMVPAMGLLFVLIPGILPRRHTDGGRSEMDRRFEGQGP